MPCLGPDTRSDIQINADYEYDIDLSKSLTYLEKTDFLLFGCPLVDLLCETCTILEKENKLQNYSQDLQDWWEEHHLRDTEIVKRSGEEIEKKYTEMHQILLRHMVPNYKFMYYDQIKKMIKKQYKSSTH